MAKFLRGRSLKDVRGQRPLFDAGVRKRILPEKKKASENVVPQRKVMREKATAFRLCNQAYAALKSQPELLRERDRKAHLREIERFIGLHKKGRLTYPIAQSAIGAATGLLKKMGTEYKP